MVSERRTCEETRTDASHETTFDGEESTLSLDIPAVSQARSVLIVDRSEENRDVLQTALQRRGLRTMSASRVRRGVELARLHRPDLIVLDLETEASSAEQVRASFSRDSELERIPIVMLGSMRKPSGGSPPDEFVAKPYQYGSLVRKIEELLGTAGHAAARCA